MARDPRHPPSSCIRPSKDGGSQDCWSRSTSRNGVNYNSPTCNGSSVTGIGHTKAEKIWYRTLSTKLTSRSDYKAARQGAIASAKELYGAGSVECQAVAAAFSAIAVPAGTQTC